MSVTPQVILLEEAWSEMFLLCTIQWFLPMDSCPLLSLPDVSPTQQAKIAPPTVYLHILEEIFNRFKALAVDPTEFACLKAIVLFKPGKSDFFSNMLLLMGEHCNSCHVFDWQRLAASKTQSKWGICRTSHNCCWVNTSIQFTPAKVPGKPVATLKHKSVCSLTVSMKFTNFCSCPSRFGRLLLLLPSLHFMSSEKIEQLFFHRTIGSTPMEKVLCDMFKN